MKTSILILMCVLHLDSFANLELSAVRNLLHKAAESKSAAHQLVKELAPVNGKSLPVLICYKGVAQMMVAKYGINPINKFSSFKKGKQWIELAVEKAPTDLEVRYLRFAIQTKLPGFLNYNHRINEDKKYLLSKVKMSTDQQLKQDIINFMTTSNHCSTAEKKELMQ